METPSAWEKERSFIGRKTRPPSPRAFREQLLKVVRAGSTPEALSRGFEPAQTIRNWVHQADVDAGREHGLTSGQQDELRRLRREVRQLRTERESLAKATAWSARETESVLPRASDS